MEMSYFYTFFFLMLEDKDLKFASYQLDDGLGANAGFSTIGGGAAATRKKHNIQEVVALDVQNLTKNAENAEGLCVDMQNAITRLFLLYQHSVISVLLHNEKVLPLLVAMTLLSQTN
jgi:hypothetical protein